ETGPDRGVVHRMVDQHVRNVIAERSLCPTRVETLKHCRIGLFAPAVALIALLWPHLGVAVSPTAPPTNFATEKEADQHCPADIGRIQLIVATRFVGLSGDTETDPA